MKKLLFIAVAAFLFSGCQKEVIMLEDATAENVDQMPKKKFTFTVKGDFGAANFTRGYLQADGQSMTDLWVYDYMNGELIQSVHQTSEDDAWGVPSMSLAYGSHHVYFVASRGADPVVDEDGHTIVWGTPRDAFWTDYEVEVVKTSNGNRAVTLDRVATKLQITINDEIPTGCSTITVTPDKWYYGIDYVTGEAVSNQKKDRTITVPESLIGTSGKLAVTIFGMSSEDEWTTNVSIKAADADANVIGSATISGAPFKRNRSTEYSGSLFASAGGMDVSVSGDWETTKTGTW